MRLGSSIRDALPIAALAVALTLASFLVRPFAFGQGNNVFHIPIVLSHHALPQFAGDETVQSLRGFVSPVYRLLAPVASGETIFHWFLALAGLTRLITFGAVLALAAIFAEGRTVPVLAASVCVFLSTAAFGPTRFGDAELLTRIFTHTALAQGVALWALVAMIRLKVVTAGLLSGIAGFLNLFVGVWLGAPYALMLWRFAARHGLTAATVRSACLSIAGGLAMVSPVVALYLAWWRDYEPFDFREFLLTYYPYHSIPFPRDASAYLSCIAFLFAGAVSFTLLPSGGRRALAAAALPLFGVFVAGAILGSVAASPLIFKLHLLRVDGLIAWLALSALAAGLAICVTAGRPLGAVAAVLVAVALMRIWHPALLIGACALLGLAAHLRPRVGDARPVIRPGLAWAAMAAVIGGLHLRDGPATARPYVEGTAPSDSQLVGHRPRTPEWRDLVVWARGNTAPDAVFLVPLTPEGFSALTERRVWVDWREGARVFWAPWTYRTWRTRFDEVAAIGSADAFVAYAQRNGIDFAVLDKRRFGVPPADGLGAPIVYENRWFAVALTRMTGGAEQPEEGRNPLAGGS